MMVKSGQEKIFLKFQNPFYFYSFYFIERRTLLQSYQFSNKNDHLSAWRDFKKKIFVVYVDMANEILSQKFHPYSRTYLGL